MSDETVTVSRARLDRLVRIENAAMRVAGSRRDGVVLDIGALDRLDAALEGSEHICSCGLRINAEQTDGQF